MQDHRNNGAGSAAQEARELGSEFGQIATEIRELIGLEADLAKAEVNEATGKVIKGVAFGAVAFLFADMAVIFLFLALMFGLDTQMPLWAAALITTLIIGLIAGVFAFVAMDALRGVSFVPKRFMRTVKEDLTWAKSLMTSRVR